MTEPDLDNLALASCPPPTIPDGVPPIDMVEERVALQREVLQYVIDHVAKCLCDSVVGIGSELKAISRYLNRLVNKELKGTGFILAEIANYLHTMTQVQVAELQIQLANMFGTDMSQAPTLPEVLPVPPTIESEPEPIPPPSFPPISASFPEPGLAPTEEFPPPVSGAVGRPVIVAPSFTPETSAAVGGETIAVPISFLTEPSDYKDLFVKPDIDA